MRSEKSLVIHVDGSNVFVSKSDVEAIGWAVIACHDDELHERYGAVPHKRRGPLTGCHEQVAFVEAVKYAHEHGFAFENTTILCDDDIMGYAQTSLHEGNYKSTEASAVRARIARVVSQLYPVETVHLVLEAVEKATIHKLKGHSRMVYQERADYLAKHAARTLCELPTEPMLDYDAWLDAGIRFYDHEKAEYQTWKAPFMDPEPSESESKSQSRTRCGVS